MTYQIVSAQNERLKRVGALREKKHRKEDGCFLIEGVRELSRAVSSGIAIQQIFWCGEDANELFKHPDWHAGTQTKIRDMLTTVSPQAFHKIAVRESGADAVAVAALPDLTELDALLAKATAVMILDDVEKPGNLGAILRSLDGAGFDGLIISGQATAADLYNPNLIRSSVGAAFHGKMSSATPDTLKAALATNGFHVFAAVPEADKPYHAQNYREKTAFVLGSEAFGVSAFWKEAATHKVSIPMLGIGDSLNVSVAAAVVSYELRRQRS